MFHIIILMVRFTFFILIKFPGKIYTLWDRYGRYGYLLLKLSLNKWQTTLITFLKSAMCLSDMSLQHDKLLTLS